VKLHKGELVLWGFVRLQRSGRRIGRFVANAEVGEADIYVSLCQEKEEDSSPELREDRAKPTVPKSAARTCCGPQKFDPSIKQPPFSGRIRDADRQEPI
jgi:hypothetical protein